MFSRVDFFLPWSIDHLFIFLKFYNFSMSVLRFTIFLGHSSKNLQVNPIKAKFADPNNPESSPVFQSSSKTNSATLVRYNLRSGVLFLRHSAKSGAKRYFLAACLKKSTLHRRLGAVKTRVRRLIAVKNGVINLILVQQVRMKWNEVE